MKRFTWHTPNDNFEWGLNFVRNNIKELGIKNYEIINAYKSLSGQERNGRRLAAECSYGDKHWCFTVEWNDD